MSPKLKPLLLPQLVEERKKRESMMDSETDLFSSSFTTQNSSSSDLPSPVTPTFSTRGHFRYPSSTSSIESAYHSTIMDSPSSPTFLAKAGKRSLPDVQEEPIERDEDFEIIDDLYSCLCDSQNCLHRDPTMAQSSIQLSAEPDFDYDISQGFLSDGEFAVSPRNKKRRANDTALTGLATRFGTRFPSFSRKFRLRRGTSSTSLASDTLRISTTPSSRSSSISNSVRRGVDSTPESRMPPTPARSVYGREDVIAPIDIDRANREQDEEDREVFATTPLLPPLMTDAAANTRQTPFQSPLQSPSVAEPIDPLSLFGAVTPIDAIIAASPNPSIPSSPLLSTKPSISSLFHHSRATYLAPCSEIPNVPLAELPTDVWAVKLGHANFTIQPEPYLPSTFTLASCRQLRADWDLARTNYTKHLVRTGEHYGTTSSTYKLTEEKWVTIEEAWRKSHEKTVTATAENSENVFDGLEYTILGDQNRDLVTKIPSLNDGRGVGKFPSLGDAEIVGPMAKVAASSPALAAGGLKRSTSTKAKIFKFIADKFPAGLGGLAGKS